MCQITCLYYARIDDLTNPLRTEIWRLVSNFNGTPGSGAACSYTEIPGNCASG